jgi:hypothetical protein
MQLNLSSELEMILRNFTTDSCVPPAPKIIKKNSLKMKYISPFYHWSLVFARVSIIYFQH